MQERCWRQWSAAQGQLDVIPEGSTQLLASWGVSLLF